jgi:hypothetical protein
MVVLCETGRGQLEGCEEYQLGRSESGLMSNLELRGGSPRPSQLRSHRLASMNKFDYVIAHMGFKVSCKLTSFDGHRIG